MGEPASIVTSRRLEWSETDPMGRWHYSAALRFVEHAETTLHTRLGIEEEAFRRMPRLNLAVDFLGPLHYAEVARTALAVEHVGRSSLRYAFTIARDGTDMTDGDIARDGTDVAARTGVSDLIDVARGTLTIVWFDPATGRSTPWPEHLRELFAAAGPQGG